MARLDELWRSVDGPGTPPRLDSMRVKARVNAALDADQAERKIYMKQKLRAALTAAAVAAALTGSAFAATTGWNGLSDWFKGDVTPGQQYVDNQVQTVSGKDYSMTVEGIVADEYNAYFTVTITALSDEAKEFILDDHFNSIDLLYVRPEYKEEPNESEGINYSCGYRELDAEGEYTRRFTVNLEGLPAPAKAVRVRCGYMEEGKHVTLSVTPAPSVTVKIGASGLGVLSVGPDQPPEPESITVHEIILTPFSCQISAKATFGLEPNIRFRMADGTVRTQAQMLDGTSAHNNGSGREFNYRFKEIQNLDSITSVIVFDMEYPLNGSKSTPVEHDASLDPITVTRMEPLSEASGYSLPVRELTEKLGGVCTWDSATGDVTCVYRDVTIVLHAGRNTALVNGETVELLNAPAVQDGVLAADYDAFNDAWGLDGFVQREHIRDEKGPENNTINWFDWYIIP